MSSDHWYMAVVVLCQDFSIHCPCITDPSRLFAGACLPCQGGPELGQILIDVDFGAVVFVFIDILQVRPGTEHTPPDITGRKFYNDLSVLACSLPAYTVRNSNVSGLQWRVNLDQLTHAQDCCICVVVLVRSRRLSRRPCCSKSSSLICWSTIVFWGRRSPGPFVVTVVSEAASGDAPLLIPCL